jgi:hypothetical protein
MLNRSIRTSQRAGNSEENKAPDEEALLRRIRSIDLIIKEDDIAITMMRQRVLMS